MNKRADKIKGALYGVAIGDALGGPLEFMSAEEIQKRYGRVTEMIGGGWMNLKPGETTDDTAMMLAVAEGIVEAPEDPVPVIGRNFIEWYNSNPKDIGATCAGAIRRAMDIASWSKMPEKKDWMRASTMTDQVMHGRTAGNGALMRTIYPGLFYKPGKDEIMKHTAEIAQMTHWSAESTNACVQYVQETFMLLMDYDGKVGMFDEKKNMHQPTGYVIDSYIVASEAVEQTRTFEDALVEAVNHGGDADTIGAIAGGMAGAKYGYSRIPNRWLAALDPEVKKRLDYVAEAAIKRWEE